MIVTRKTERRKMLQETLQKDIQLDLVTYWMTAMKDFLVMWRMIMVILPVSNEENAKDQSSKTWQLNIELVVMTEHPSRNVW